MTRSTGPAAAFAVGWSAPGQADAAAQTGVSAGSLLQLGAGLALVIAMVFLCAWLARRFALPVRGANDALKVIAAAPIGQRERVVVLELGDTWIVVGVAPGHVSALHSMPRAPAAAHVPGQVPVPPFSAWLNRLTEKHRA